MSSDNRATAVPAAAQEYLTGVRAALADLPPTDLDEIVDDTRLHLEELAAELGTAPDRAALDARLGSPSAYAAELRAAAGYPPAPATAPRAGTGRLALAALVVGTALVAGGTMVRSPLLLLGFLVAAAGLLLVLRDGPDVASVRSLPLVDRVLADRPSGATGRVVTYLAGLQPGWWLVRAVAAAVLAAAAVGVIDAAVVLVLVLVALPISVWIGYRSRADRRWLWVVVPLNALAAVAVLYAATTVLGANGPTGASSYPVYQPGLSQDGQPVADVRPFDGFGKPLTNVYLFDQAGRPLDTGPSAECSGDQPVPSSAPYPRGYRQFDPQTGQCEVVPPAPLVVSVPTATAVPPR